MYDRSIIYLLIAIAYCIKYFAIPADYYAFNSQAILILKRVMYNFIEPCFKRTIITARTCTETFYLHWIKKTLRIKLEMDSTVQSIHFKALKLLWAAAQSYAKSLIDWLYFYEFKYQIFICYGCTKVLNIVFFFWKYSKTLVVL